MIPLMLQQLQVVSIKSENFVKAEELTYAKCSKAHQLCGKAAIQQHLPENSGNSYPLELQSQGPSLLLARIF